MELPGNRRGRRTRETLLSTTRAILEEDGFEALTMRAVADRAGVTRAAVYLHFPSRGHLVNALFDHMAAAANLDGSLSQVWSAPDAEAALLQWARHLAHYHVRLLAVDRAVQRVQHADPDAATHRSRVSAAKLANCRRLANWVAAEDRLATPWTVATAADMLYALSTSDVVEGLVVDRRWSRRRFAEHLGALLVATFVTAETS